ncbi:YqzL family protein [Alteribacillus bidgolensis]|uniref:YqzL-like protein n=1 Tax=Alteribacillus bidgolensis TaxID=930129 RepID=A0A1G8P026_9BACI|nr:YqzL family protein [Alteribacillus bidgolensis]SDI85891.1 YqzL-like protein [Alteribacillus bidgolensis]
MFEDRDFSWKYFFMTGNINAYLLTKELEQANNYSEENEDQLSFMKEEME